jgi:hypothetical protein
MDSNDLRNFGPEGRNKPSPMRKNVKVFIFTALLVGSILVLLATLAMQPSALRTTLIVILSLNAIASMVNLFRTFRPHKTD